MHKITQRLNRSFLMFCAVFTTAVGALAYSPSTASAQSEAECWFCKCENGECICIQVVCPS